MNKKPCSHHNQINEDVIPSTPDAKTCEDCVKTGDTWVSLRMCLICGHVGCCDNSKNTHATKHFHETKHPVMKSVTPGEVFSWCYVDELYL
jgi:uncharacterized UBP type Zn finger protein